MQDPELPHLEIGSPRDEAELTVILMHGLGADGHDFADVATALCNAALPRSWRFVLPHAPEIPVTINMGTVMPAWYDILDLQQPRNVNWQTVEHSQKSIAALLDQEKQTADKLVLAGFSQGAAMALHVGLRHQGDVAGIAAMSGYLLESAEFPPPTPAPGPGLPIAIYHGSDDPVVPLQAAKSADETLSRLGFPTTFKQYDDLEHGVCEEEIRDLFFWLDCFSKGFAEMPSR